MAGEGHRAGGAKLLEELDLLQRAAATGRCPETTAAAARRPSCLRPWKDPLAVLDGVIVRRGRSRCVVCLQVHRASGLPPCLDGRALAVGWRTKGRKGELTLPSHVHGGGASFEEIFLHCRDADARSTSRLDLTVWVSLVEAGGCDLGTFDIDLRGLLSAPPGCDEDRPNFGGKTVSLDLSGVAKGGVLLISIYCRVIKGEIGELQKQRMDGGKHKLHSTLPAMAPADRIYRPAAEIFTSGAAEKRRGKCGCFPPLPDLRHRRTRPLGVLSVRRTPSMKSETGFITIENAQQISFPSDDEEDGFITLEEKGPVHRRALSGKRPPSSNSFDIGEDGAGAEPLFAFDADGVEDEFLRMLEEKSGENDGRDAGGGGAKETEEDEPEPERGFPLLKAAEREVGDAAGARREGRRGAGAALEEEEHEELVGRWEAGSRGSSEGGTGGVHGLF